MRLDSFLSENGYVKSRSHASVLIKGGNVFVNGKEIRKPSFEVGGNEQIRLENDLPYVSRGGLKLAGALQSFCVDVTDFSCLDIGASTGGFTDCLLQNGAKSVVALDCGVGQLDEKLRSDSRVTSLEKCNARNLAESVGTKTFDLIVMDVSFISATYILPQFPDFLTENGTAIVLVKPQFEVGREHLDKKGIVREEKYRRSALEKVKKCGTDYGLSFIGSIPSPIKGGDGNTEYLIYFQKSVVKTNENSTDYKL